jgi:hypothetical protein
MLVPRLQHSPGPHPAPTIPILVLLTTTTAPPATAAPAYQRPPPPAVTAPPHQLVRMHPPPSHDIRSRPLYASARPAPAHHITSPPRYSRALSLSPPSASLSPFPRPSPHLSRSLHQSPDHRLCPANLSSLQSSLSFQSLAERLPSGLPDEQSLESERNLGTRRVKSGAGKT